MVPMEPQDQAGMSEWNEFEERLAAYLATMADQEDYLILEAPNIHGAATGPYAQFAREGDGQMLRAEVTANTFLAPEARLDTDRVAALEAAGWRLADGDDPNHFCEAPSGNISELARAALTALREQYGVPHPQLLSVQAGGPAAEQVETLGLAGTGDIPEDSVATESAAFIAEPESREHLIDLIGHALRDHVDVEPEADDDGDYVLEHDGQAFVLQVSDDEPAVEVLARVAHDVPDPRQAEIEIGAFNRDYPWGKWVLIDRSDVVQSLMIPAMPFSSDQLGAMLQLFVAILDETRDDIARRVGGTPG